jgi:hypothetical protein
MELVSAVGYKDVAEVEDVAMVLEGLSFIHIVN